jgi:2-methylisocitrate lyase-like PEP mutase family enzyme
VSRAEAIGNAALIFRLTGLPVNGDLEDGFGPTPEDCVATVEAAIAAGLAGLGIEDTTADPAEPIHGFDHAVARIRAAAQGGARANRADGAGRQLPPGPAGPRRHHPPPLAFAEAGADVLYAPGLPDMAAIEAVVRAVAPLPVNVVFGPRSGRCRWRCWRRQG